MSNITARVRINVFSKACCGASAHMRNMSVAEFQKYLLRKGCYMTDNIEDVEAFIRRRYPGLTDAEIMNVVNRCVACLDW